MKRSEYFMRLLKNKIAVISIAASLTLLLTACTKEQIPFDFDSIREWLSSIFESAENTSSTVSELTEDTSSTVSEPIEITSSNTPSDTSSVQLTDSGIMVGKTYVVTGITHYLSIKDAPSINNSHELGKMKEGDKLVVNTQDVYGDKGEYCHITAKSGDAKGKTGYVLKSFIALAGEKNNETSSAAASSAPQKQAAASSTVSSSAAASSAAPVVSVVPSAPKIINQVEDIQRKTNSENANTNSDTNSPDRSQTQVQESKTSGEMFTDYVSLLRDYAESGEWKNNCENPTGGDPQWCDEVSYNIIDLDEDGVPEMLVWGSSQKYSGPRPMTASSFCVIGNGNVKTIKSGSTCGGTMGGTSVNLCQEKSSGKFMICHGSYTGGFGGQAGSSAYYSYSGGSLSQQASTYKVKYSTAGYGTDEFKVNDSPTTEDAVDAKNAEYEMIYYQDISSKLTTY